MGKTKRKKGNGMGRANVALKILEEIEKPFNERLEEAKKTKILTVRNQDELQNAVRIRDKYGIKRLQVLNIPKG